MKLEELDWKNVAGNCGAIKFIEFKDTSLESGGNEFVV